MIKHCKIRLTSRNTGQKMVGTSKKKSGVHRNQKNPTSGSLPAFGAFQPEID